MNVAFITSETAPFASTGGLADVAASLPKALYERGLNVVRIMPLYRRVAESGLELRNTGLQLDIPVGYRNLYGEVWYVENPPPRTYFIRREEFFDRSELYSLPERDYDDNCERFVFFQKAAVECLDALGLDVDVVHCNDWQSGLIPMYLSHGLTGRGRNRLEKALFTIHNLAYQGLFPGSDFPTTGLPFSCFDIGMLEFYGNMNFIKAGIATADMVTTVSDTYAREIQTPAFGCGLEGVLQEVADRLHGIVNGVDYSVWDPATDELIPANYSTDDFSGKAACRTALLERFGLKAKPDIPVVGMVTRLVDQKGMDILAEAIPALMEQGTIRLVLLGSGRLEYNNLCRSWQSRWPEMFAAEIGYNPVLAREIEAGADMFLMPSRFEPCGLNQLYSLRYGTIPVVHATGGLADTVEDVAEDGSAGNGIVFTQYTADALAEAVNRAVTLFQDRRTWRQIQVRAMEADYSWDRSAGDYIKLYESMLGD